MKKPESMGFGNLDINGDLGRRQVSWSRGNEAKFQCVEN